jgi:hypothetical protein
MMSVSVQTGRVFQTKLKRNFLELLLFKVIVKSLNYLPE